MAKRVVLAMSGGVDSSAAAVLLKRQGFDVVGLFMRTGDHGSAAHAPARKQGCCSALDAGDARRVADRLDIPFYALDFEAEFDQIIDHFADEYLHGRTPNPCVECNTRLKFGKLWAFGKQLAADHIATGHYARIVVGPTGPELHRGLDSDKDQSYVLYGLRRTLLDRVMFPVGGLPKAEVRAVAREAGLGVADKPDSVEICFVPDGDHAGLIRRRRTDAGAGGLIVEKSGAVLGPHDGIERFTVGQRKGLGVAAGARRYVLEILPESRTVVVGDREDLLAAGLTAERVNWLIDAPTESLACVAKIRYRHIGAEATVAASADGTATVRFVEPQTAVTPGQAVVFYSGDRVLGGGTIARAERTNLPDDA